MFTTLAYALTTRVREKKEWNVCGVYIVTSLLPCPYLSLTLAVVQQYSDSSWKERKNIFSVFFSFSIIVVLFSCLCSMKVKNYNALAGFIDFLNFYINKNLIFKMKSSWKKYTLKTKQEKSVNHCSILLSSHSIQTTSSCALHQKYLHFIFSSVDALHLMPHEMSALVRERWWSLIQHPREFRSFEQANIFWNNDDDAAAFNFFLLQLFLVLLIFSSSCEKSLLFRLHFKRFSFPLTRSFPFSSVILSSTFYLLFILSMFACEFFSDCYETLQEHLKRERESATSTASFVRRNQL